MFRQRNHLLPSRHTISFSHFHEVRRLISCFVVQKWVTPSNKSLSLPGIENPAKWLKELLHEAIAEGQELFCLFPTLLHFISYTCGAERIELARGKIEKEKSYKINLRHNECYWEIFLRLWCWNLLILNSSSLFCPNSWSVCFASCTVHFVNLCVKTNKRINCYSIY
jgi:hypothetical protein